MVSVGQILGISAAAGFAVNQFTSYAIKSSSFLTALAIFFLLIVPKFTYSVLIYPHFLSPLRHLPQPPVRTLLHMASGLRLTTTGRIMDLGPREKDCEGGHGSSYARMES